MKHHKITLKFSVLLTVVLVAFITGSKAQPPITYGQPPANYDGNLVRTYIANGDNRMRIGDINGAIADYTIAISSGAGSYGEALVKRAIALRMQGRVTEANADMNNAVRADIKYQAMYDSLTTKGMRRDSLSRVNNPYETIDFNNVKEDTSTFVTLAVNRLETADFDIAINYLKAYLIKNTSDSLAMFYLAIAYTNIEQYDLALFNLRSVLPKGDALVYNLFGLYHYRQGFYIDAIDNFNKAVRANPSFSIAYFNRAMCKKRMGNDRGYTDDFEKAIEAEAYLPNMYFNRGYFEQLTGDMGLADADYTTARGLDKFYNHGYFKNLPSKKLLSFFTPFYNELIATVNKDETDADAFYNRAAFEMLFGEYTSAIIDFNKATTLNPQNPDYIFNRGLARLVKNDNNMGCRDIKKAIELGADRATLIQQKFCK